MEKDFLDDLIEELQKLRAEDNPKVPNAIEAPVDAIQAFGRVLRNHKLNVEELGMLISHDGIDKSEADLLMELQKKEKND